MFLRTSTDQIDFAPEDGPRVMFYCASNIGMGHLGRVTRIARALRERLEDVDILLATDATGEPLAQAMREFAVARLPGFAFQPGDEGAFDERPWRLALTKRQLAGLRARMLDGLAAGFQPHVLWMDTLPHGKRDEMRQAARRARRTGTRVLLCMRDIPCPPGESFKFTGAPRDIQKRLAIYDEILIAGDAKFFDPTERYGWPARVRDKTTFLGFVAPPSTTGDRPAPPTKRIVASAGGGWQAGEMARDSIAAWRRVQERIETPLELRIFTGPAIDAAEFDRLRDETKSESNVCIERFSTEFSAVLSGADAAILQAGSTPFQILESDIPILLTYRDYKDKEQELRAKLLAEHDGVALAAPDQWSVDWLTDELHSALSRPREARKTGYSFDGVDHAVERIAENLNH